MFQNHFKCTSLSETATILNVRLLDRESRVQNIAFTTTYIPLTQTIMGHVSKERKTQAKT